MIELLLIAYRTVQRPVIYVRRYLQCESHYVITLLTGVIVRILPTATSRYPLTTGCRMYLLCRWDERFLTSKSRIRLYVKPAKRGWIPFHLYPRIGQMGLKSHVMPSTTMECCCQHQPDFRKLTGGITVGLRAASIPLVKLQQV